MIFQFYLDIVALPVQLLRKLYLVEAAHPVHLLTSAISPICKRLLEDSALRQWWTIRS